MTAISAPRVARLRAMVANGTAKTIRTSAGLTLRDVCVDVGVDHSTLLRWERGDNIPDRENSLRYLEVLDAIAGFGR